MSKVLEANEPYSKNRVWVVYNHMPYGKVVATHFDTVVRNQKLPDETVRRVLFTSEEQMEGFLKTPQVSLCVATKGLDGNEILKIEKNKVLIYPKEKDLSNLRDPAEVVLKWAEEMGVRQVPDPKNKEIPKTDFERIVKMETRIAMLEDGQHKIASSMDRLSSVMEKMMEKKNEKERG